MLRHARPSQKIDVYLSLRFTIYSKPSHHSPPHSPKAGYVLLTPVVLRLSLGGSNRILLDDMSARLAPIT